MLSPLLSGSCLDCRLWPLLREDAPCNGWRQSSTIQNQAHPSISQAVSPTFPFSIARRQIPPRCAGAQDPEHTVDKLPVILGNPAHCPRRPDICGSNSAHTPSIMSYRCCSFPMTAPPYFLGTSILPYFSCKHYLDNVIW